MREGQESASLLTDKGIMSEIKHTWESNQAAILVRGPAPRDYRRIAQLPGSRSVLSHQDSYQQI